MGNQPQDKLKTVSEDHWVDSVPIRDGSDKVGIRKCRIKDLRLVSGAISTLAKELSVDTDGNFDMNMLSDVSNILKLISLCADEVYKVCAALSSLKLPEFEDLDMDDGIAVALKAFEVNKDFLVTKVKPMLDPYIAVVGQQLTVEEPSNGQQESETKTEAA